LGKAVSALADGTTRPKAKQTKAARKRRFM
jgi:hypothetical protein